MLNQDCREDEDLIHLPVWLNAVYWEQIGQMKAWGSYEYLRFWFRKCNNWVKNLFVVNFSCFFSRKVSYVGCIKMVRCMLMTWDNFGALVLFCLDVFGRKTAYKGILSECHLFFLGHPISSKLHVKRNYLSVNMNRKGSFRFHKLSVNFYWQSFLNYRKNKDSCGKHYMSLHCNLELMLLHVNSEENYVC